MAADSDRWPRIAVVGAGAVGCYFGGRLARAGAPVTLIGRPSLVGAVREDGGLFIDSREFREQVTLAASTDPGAVAGADLVLLAVKTLDTVSAARSFAAHLRADAIVVSLQNGVDNADRIRAEIGLAVIPAVVYVAAAMTGPARVKHSGRGDLIIGWPAENPARDVGLSLDEIARTFGRAGVACAVSANVTGELWVKLIMNAAYNAISALAKTTYGAIAEDPGARVVIRQVLEEAVAVAERAGVTLPGENLLEAAYRLGRAMPAAISSTAQDLDRGRPTEIDSLNGYLARRGAELGVPTPVNLTLQTLVKLREAAVPR
jgi:2-dehydropantoate 2-reductase